MFYRLPNCIFLVLVFATCLFSTEALAQISPEKTHKAKGRPTVGLVLGGGGAKGLAHVGVIKILEENQIPVDVIAGTSMGAIVGALYASGYSADELENITNGMDWRSVFNDKTTRNRTTFRRRSDEFGFLTDYKVTFKNGKIVLPQGIIQGQSLFLELSRLLSETRSVGNFDDLPIPFRLVATDLATGKEVVMREGDLASAVFASMAIPGLIPPVERRGKHLIDGGLVNNLPVDIAREMGADIVIVVNVGSDPLTPDDIGNFIDVLRQTQILLTQENTIKQIGILKSKDILITPTLDGLGTTSFDQAALLTKRGGIAGRIALPDLSKLSLSDKDWLEHLLARLATPQRRPIIDRVTISQNSKLSDEILRTGISLRKGDKLDPSVINKDIDRLYGAGIYSRITYDVEVIGDETVLEIEAKVKETSDGYFKFGVSLDSNLENKSAFILGVSYTKPQMNKWSGEWRTEINLGDTVAGETGFYQPIGAKQKFFVEPSVFLQRDKVNFFDSTDQLRGELKTLGAGASLQGGFLLNRWGELRGGLTLSKVRISLSDKSLGIENFTVDDNFILARFTVDTLDSLSFPTSGTIFTADYQIHDTFLGGDTEFNQMSFEAFKPVSVGRHTFGLGTRLSGTTGDDSNLIGANTLGGFLSLSGFSEDELSGRYAAMALGTYYYRLNKQATLFDYPIYIGGSVEAGNVYSTFDEISLDDAILASSLFAGLKSPLGPVFVGVGYNDKGNTSLYFSIGSFF